MKKAHGLVEMYLLNNTELTEQDHEIKFHCENIVHATLMVTLSDGSVHDIPVADISKLNWTLFEDNDENSNKKPLSNLA